MGSDRLQKRVACTACKKQFEGGFIDQKEYFEKYSFPPRVVGLFCVNCKTFYCEECCKTHSIKWRLLPGWRKTKCPSCHEAFGPGGALMSLPEEGSILSSEVSSSKTNVNEAVGPGEASTSVPEEASMPTSEVSSSKANLKSTLAFRGFILGAVVFPPLVTLLAGKSSEVIVNVLITVVSTGLLLVFYKALRFIGVAIYAVIMYSIWSGFGVVDFFAVVFAILVCGGVGSALGAILGWILDNIRGNAG